MYKETCTISLEVPDFNRLCGFYTGTCNISVSDKLIGCDELNCNNVKSTLAPVIHSCKIYDGNKRFSFSFGMFICLQVMHAGHNMFAYLFNPTGSFYVNLKSNYDDSFISTGKSFPEARKSCFDPNKININENRSTPVVKTKTAALKGR